MRQPTRPGSKRSNPPPPPTGKSRPAKKSPPKVIVPDMPEFIFEADAAEGLERIAAAELRDRFGTRIEMLDSFGKPGVLRFVYVGNPFQVTTLRSFQAVYLCENFAIPRPKALLGNQHFKKLLAQIALVRELAPPDTYKSLVINAAGSDSSVMRRLKDELAANTGLESAAGEGDLLIRLRHPLDGSEGWEALIRLTPRPLATRSWRVCNWQGALNAAVAHAMAFLTLPTPEDVFLNMTCGSGTLLIERLAICPAASATGYDIDPLALECARKNIEAAGYAEQVKLNLGDARSLPMANKSVDAICADLPFGHLVGSHESNVEIYPGLLDEAARVLKPGGRCVLLSHEVRLMESLLDESPRWDVEQNIRVAQGGLNPRIYVLVRR